MKPKQPGRLKGKEYIAPWERAFDRVLTPIEEFIHRQTTSGILLMACAVAALWVAIVSTRQVLVLFLNSLLPLAWKGFS